LGWGDILSPIVEVEGIAYDCYAKHGWVPKFPNTPTSPTPFLEYQKILFNTLNDPIIVKDRPPLHQHKCPICGFNHKNEKVGGWELMGKMSLLYQT
jgi:hypothetical protein